MTHTGFAVSAGVVRVASRGISVSGPIATVSERVSSGALEIGASKVPVGAAVTSVVVEETGACDVCCVEAGAAVEDVVVTAAAGASAECAVS